MITTKNATILIALSLTACGVKVNGKSYGLGGGGGSTSPASGASASSGSSGSSGSSESGAPESGSSESWSRDDAPVYAAAGSQCYQMGSDGDHPPILSSPADPWLAVADGQAAALKKAFTVWQEGDCTAEHDHCLRDCVWFPGPETKNEPDTTGPVVYQGDGRLRGRTAIGGMIEDRTLYRTVPATKRMLTRGALVVAVEKMAATPIDSTQKWYVGELDRVDWKNETLYMIGSPNPYRLSATRVAVLSWREGGKVEIVGGRKRDELAVKTNELFLPKTIVTTSDPWSQVKDGQPIVVADDQPFATSAGDCTPARDHCLRPWTWFVDLNSDYVYPAKFDGKTFQSLRAIDELKPLDGIVAAYRTVPATASNLKVGARVFMVYRGTEQSANTDRSDVVKVLRVRSDGKFEGQGRSNTQTFEIDDARVPVVVWFPGEKAEAFP